MNIFYKLKKCEKFEEKKLEIFNFYQMTNIYL